MEGWIFVVLLSEGWSFTIGGWMVSACDLPEGWTNSVLEVRHTVLEPVLGASEGIVGIVEADSRVRE